MHHVFHFPSTFSDETQSRPAQVRFVREGQRCATPVSVALKHDVDEIRQRCAFQNLLESALATWTETQLLDLESRRSVWCNFEEGCSEKRSNRWSEDAGR